jgi:hypothetical protein
MQQVFRRMNGICKVKELSKNRRHFGNVYNKFYLDYSQLFCAVHGSKEKKQLFQINALGWFMIKNKSFV